MASSKYYAYLTSRPWAKRVAAVKIRAGSMCERCKRRPLDHIHHLTYERIFNEPPDDLLGVCHPCHAFLHAKSDFDPAEAHNLPTPKPYIVFCHYCKEKVVGEPFARNDHGQWFCESCASFLEATRAEALTHAHA